MSVEDWAREQALEDWPDAIHDRDGMHWRIGFVAGAKSLADALLSDEACDEIAKVVWGSMPGDDRTVVRAALEAAVRAVTEGESE